MFVATETVILIQNHDFIRTMTKWFLCPNLTRAWGQCGVKRETENGTWIVCFQQSMLGLIYALQELAELTFIQAIGSDKVVELNVIGTLKITPEHLFFWIIFSEKKKKFGHWKRISPILGFNIDQPVFFLPYVISWYDDNHNLRSYSHISHAHPGYIKHTKKRFVLKVAEISVIFDFIQVNWSRWGKQITPGESPI